MTPSREVAAPIDAAHQQVFRVVGIRFQPEGILAELLATPGTTIQRQRWIARGIGRETQCLGACRVVGRLALPAHMVGRRGAAHPERDLERPRSKPFRQGFAFQFECAYQSCGAPKLVESQEPERVAHEHRQAAMHGVGVTQPAKDERERRQSEIGFGLAAAGWEEEKVDDLALDVGRVGDAAEVHQDVGELEGAPLRRAYRGRRAALLLCSPPPRCGGHGSVGDPKRFQQVRIVEEVDARLNTIRRAGGPAHQFVGHLTAPAGESLRTLALAFDPVAIRMDKRIQRPLRVRRVVQGAERLHAKLDIGDARWFHTFHCRTGHPLGMHPWAFAIVRFRARGHIVADGEFRRVPVMEVGEAFVPVVAVEAARIVSWDERTIRGNAHLDLESESRVLQIVVLPRGPPIDDEKGDGAGIQAAFGSPNPGFPNQADELKAVARGHVEPNRRPDWNRRKIDVAGLCTRTADPRCEAAPARTRGRLVRGLIALVSGIGCRILFGCVVPPGQRNVEARGGRVRQQAQTHGRRQKDPFAAAAFGCACVVAALCRLGRLVEFFLGILRPLRVRRPCRRQETGQIPARRRGRQSLVLESRVSDPRANQVESQRLDQVVADRGAIVHGSCGDHGHDATLALPEGRRTPLPPMRSSAARWALRANKRASTLSRTSSGQR